MPQGQTPITITGTLGQDPELRDAAGAQVASFSVAVSERTKQGDEWVDGATTWFRCSAWRELGQNIVASLHKGDRVIVVGTIGERKYTDREGTEKSSWEVTAEAVGPELRFATAHVERVQRGGGGPRSGPSRPPVVTRQSAPQQQDRWVDQSASYDESTPF